MPQPPSVHVHPSAPILRVLRTCRRNDLLVITADGEIDLASAGLLRRALWQDLPRHTVLDLSGVSFMAAAGLRVLEEAAERAHLERRKVAVVARTHPAARVLRLAGFDRMPIYPRLADAVRELPAWPTAGPLLWRSADERGKLAPRGVDQGSAEGVTMHDRAHDVSAALLELTESLRAGESRDETLARMAARAVALLPGADAASVTLFDGGVPRTVAATEESVLVLDKAQYSLDDGPCLEATRTETVVRTDTALAHRRWPAFGEAAAGAGVETMLSCPLFVGVDDAVTGDAARQHHLSGALNVWSRQQSVFDPMDAALIALFTSAMSGVILTAARWGHAQRQARQLRTALESRDAIATAKGIVMARRGLTADEAFAWLTELSQRTNRKVRDIATIILAQPAIVEPAQRGSTAGSY